jgi:hypothetical protein
MLTFFTTAKAFRGHDGVIQRNALASWKLLHPEVEVILFGDDAGAADVSAELGLRHEPKVMRHESGAKYLHDIFRRARDIAKHDYLCFCNCDIILMEDFREAFKRATRWRRDFLMVARRWDTDIVEAIDFDRELWSKEVQKLARTRGFCQDESWIDFFLFKRDRYAELPALIVGHCYWDNWMIWQARANSVPVLDASPFMTAVHQNHGYDPRFGRTKGSPKDPLSLLNLAAVGGPAHLRRIDAATHRMTRKGEIRGTFVRNTYRLREPFLRIQQALTYRIWIPAWHRVLGITRPIRAAVGLRAKASRQPAESGLERH